MSSGLIVQTRSLGQPKPLLDDFSVPLPPGSGSDAEHRSLRDVITAVVHDQVRLSNDSPERSSFVRILTSRELREGLARGKVDSGGHRPQPAISASDATAAALAAFTEGRYLVTIDGKECRDLDETVRVHPGSRVCFVRLVLLIGG